MMERLPNSVREILSQFGPDEVRVAGSSIDPSVPTQLVGDIDLFAHDTLVLARLLHLARAERSVHVCRSLVPVQNLHEQMTFRNLCRAMGPDGQLYTSDRFVEGKTLLFNRDSVAAFPTYHIALRTAAKLITRGYSLPAIERARFRLAFNPWEAELADYAATLLGAKVVAALGRDAVVAGGLFRDAIDGRDPKDADVFVVGGPDRWEEVCQRLLTAGCEEIGFEAPPGKRINVRKFRSRACTLDVIEYGYAARPEHVVASFDFVHNMLWWQPGDAEVRGTDRFLAREIIRLVRERTLIVGDNLWYRAGLRRALHRWARFRADGYVADEEQIKKYQRYLTMMGAKVRLTETLQENTPC